MGAPKPKITDSTSSTTNTPWGPAAPALTDMVSAAGAAYAATPKTGTYVDPNADQLNAWKSAESAASGMGVGVDQTRQLALDELSGKYLSPDSNPYIKGAVTAAIDPLQKALGQRILTLGDAAQQGGAFGGDRQQLMAGQAIGDFNRDAMNTSANIYAQNYSNERNLQMGAPSLLHQADLLSLMPSQVLDATGQEKQAQAEAKLSSAVDAPWAGLDRYSQVLSTLTPYASQNSTSHTEETAAKPGGLASLFGGALGGASAGAAFGPWGALIGGGIGGLSSLFGGG